MPREIKDIKAVRLPNYVHAAGRTFLLMIADKMDSSLRLPDARMLHVRF